MTDSRLNPRTFRLPFLLAITVAVLGAVWSVVRRDGCNSCNSAAMLVGDLNLGLIGLVFYTALLGLSLWILRRSSPEREAGLPRALAVPVLLATGAHLTLVALLAKNRLMCPSCLLTAAGAFAASAVVVGSRTWNLRWATLMVAAMASVTFVGLKSLKGDKNKVALRQGYLAEQLLLKEAKPSQGTARLVVFAHPTCHVCKRFTGQVLTPLRKQYPGDQLRIEERLAWKGMATPTSVVLGKQTALLVGFRDLTAVRSAVEAARGVSQSRQAALP